MPSRSDDPVDPMASERLEAYLDGELDASAALELERRLEGSSELAAELELAREVRGALRGLPEFDASPVTLRRVMRRAAGEPPRSASSWRWRRAAALAAGIALAVLGLSLWRAAERPSTPGSVGSAGPIDPVEVARAAEEARWVLARVDRLTRKAGSRVRQDVLARYLVAPARRGIESSLDLDLGSRSGAVPPPAGSSLRGEQQDDA